MVVRLTGAGACDLAGARRVTSEQLGARRYVHIDASSLTRTYVFPGGCVTQHFRGAGPSAAGMDDTASTEVGFTTREQLRRALAQRSDGRLQLDPGQPR